MKEMANRRSALESVNSLIEKTVIARTQDLTREVGERRQAEESLKKSQAQLQTIVENLAEGIAVADLNGVLLHFNRAALEMHGFATTEECLRHLSEFAGTFEWSNLDGTLLSQAQWPLSRILRGERLRDLEVRVRRPGMDFERVFNYGGTLVYDATGKPLMAVVTINDITSRKRAAADLENAHRELLETSRLAGMAEVATGVLHNVGNVLNSVNVSATLVADKLKRSRGTNLGKVAALLQEHEAELGEFVTRDAKGRQIPSFLAALAEHLDRERAGLLAEVDQLQKNVEHIKDIVAMQQSYAKVSGVSEVIQITDLIEDALRINASGLERHHIQVARDFEEVPPIRVEKHKVLQILVNLIRNSKYACNEGGKPDKRLTVRMVKRGGGVQIEVIDNGVGIPPENLSRIFNHGFTTRKDGHGFGLHSGALAAQEMGGSLIARSDGLGRGATFTVELPSVPPAELAA
jgi:PAS domain S-box-containing protein